MCLDFIIKNPVCSLTVHNDQYNIEQVFFFDCFTIYGTWYYTSDILGDYIEYIINRAPNLYGSI